MEKTMPTQRHYKLMPTRIDRKPKYNNIMMKLREK